MNNVGEIINHSEIVKSCREFSASELMRLLRLRISIFWSWGASKFIVDNVQITRMFRMNVQGHHHKGHVYIFLNGLDLFDVYLTSNRGTIKEIGKDLYLDID